METIEDILSEMINLAKIDKDSDDKIPRKHMASALSEYAHRIEAEVKVLEADRDNWRRQALDEDARANATCKDSLHVYTMDKWAYPLTNVCKCGNNQEAKPCATIKDANGIVVLHVIGIPWRSPKEAIAMATDFCERMNNAESNKCGNVAELRDAVKSLLELLYDKGIDEETVLISHKNPVLRESLHTDRTLEVLRKAKTELAKPQMNINKINSYDEMVSAWNDYVYHRSNERFSLASFFVWLFAEVK